MSKVDNSTTDSVLTIVVNFNHDNPVKYRDKWLPTMELVRALDKLHEALPSPTTPGDNTGTMSSELKASEKDK